MSCYRSYAKINLILEIQKKREDGYHQIRTILQEIDLYDEIYFSVASDIVVTVAYSDKIADSTPIEKEDNIVFQVAKLVKSRYRVNNGIEIKICKNIPIAAGLGGGSSNAAAVINILSSVWNLGLSVDEMNSLATDIGSDVPFFLTGGSALGEGRGERITKIEKISINNLLLIKPKYGISSRTAYSLWKDDGKEDMNLGSLYQGNHFSLSDIRNDLEPGVRANYPEIDGIIKLVGNEGAVKCVLSGSGPTIIGIYDDEEILNQHYSMFEKKGYWVFKSKTRN